MNNKKVAFIFLWAGLGWLNYGAALGNLQARERIGEGLYSPSEQYRNCRENQGFAALWGGVLAPMSIFISPFVTGFYQDGFQWSCSKAKEQP